MKIGILNPEYLDGEALRWGGFEIGRLGDWVKGRWGDFAMG